MSAKRRKASKNKSKPRVVDPGRVRGALLARFERSLTHEGVADDDVSVYRDVVDSAIGMKDAYGFGDSPTHWEANSTMEIVAHTMPSKTIADADYAELVVPAMCAYLEFLMAQGRLTSARDEAETIIAELKAEEKAIVERFASMESKGVASRIAAQAMAEGVDFSDEEQVAAFMADFNERSFEERSAILGDSVGGLPFDDDAFDEDEFDEDEFHEDTGPSVVSLSHVAPDEEIAVLRSLPLMGALSRVVEWVGEQRELEGVVPRNEDLDSYWDAIGWEDLSGARAGVTSVIFVLWLAAHDLGIIAWRENLAVPGENSWSPGDNEWLDRGRLAVGSFVLTDYLLRRHPAREGKTSANELDDQEFAGAWGAMACFACTPLGIDPDALVDAGGIPKGRDEYIRRQLRAVMLAWQQAGIVEPAEDGWRVRQELQASFGPILESVGIAVEFVEEV